MNEKIFQNMMYTGRMTLVQGNKYCHRYFIKVNFSHRSHGYLPFIKDGIFIVMILCRVIYKRKIIITNEVY